MSDSDPGAPLGAAPDPAAGRAPRSIGRVHVLRMVAPPLGEPATLTSEGYRLEHVHRDDGAVTCLVLADDDELVGEVTIHPRGHGDPFYGKYSMSDERYCYGSKLEIRPAFRRRDLGRQMVRVARGMAFEQGGRGVISLVAPDNAASLRCHELEGFVPTVELQGIRVGDRTLWYRRRSIRP